MQAGVASKPVWDAGGSQRMKVSNTEFHVLGHERIRNDGLVLLLLRTPRLALSGNFGLVRSASF